MPKRSVWAYKPLLSAGFLLLRLWLLLGLLAPGLRCLLQDLLPDQASEGLFSAGNRRCEPLVSQGGALENSSE